MAGFMEEGPKLTASHCFQPTYGSDLAFPTFPPNVPDKMSGETFHPCVCLTDPVNTSRAFFH